MLKIIKNPDKELFEYAKQKLRENDGYCPCALEHKPEYKCPCENFRNMTTPGECYCGMYEKIEQK